MTNDKYCVVKSAKKTFSGRFSRLLSLSFIICYLSFSTVRAQTSDSLILYQLKDYGIRFTDDNSVTLLMSG